MSERVALVGAGVIGAGWAVQLLSRGHEVAVVDPSPTAADVVRRAADRAAPALERMGFGLGDWEPRLWVGADLPEALTSATWVQENGSAGALALGPTDAFDEAVDRLHGAGPPPTRRGLCTPAVRSSSTGADDS